MSVVQGCEKIMIHSAEWGWALSSPAAQTVAKAVALLGAFLLNV
jgi:hypothetical protein